MVTAFSHRGYACISLVIAMSLMVACGGGSQIASHSTSSSGSNSSSGSTAASLVVSPSTMSFGTIAVGSTQTQSGSLTASGAAVTVSTASWNGQGYSLSGITFPITVPAGSSIPFTVTFTPQSSGASSGTLSFFDSASTSAVNVNLNGTGSAPVQYSVSLSWAASASSVTGYNIYRGAHSGGPYTRMNASLITNLSFSDTTVQSGATYYYAATSVDSNNVESGYSNIAMASIP